MTTPESADDPDFTQAAELPESSVPSHEGGVDLAHEEGRGTSTRGRFGILIVLLMVVLADITLYQAEGFCGPAFFFCGAAILVFAGIPRRSIGFCTILLSVMLGAASYRLATSGTVMLIIAGLWLLNGLTLSLRGQTPFLLETIVFAAQCIPGGYEFFNGINDRVRDRVLGPVDSGKSSRLLEIGLPVGSLLLFGGVFVMANPDMVSWVSGTLGDLVEIIRRFLFRFSVMEVVFWCSIAWLTGGLLRPVVGPIVAAAGSDTDSRGTGQSPLYSAFRNTLITVIVLFAVYLMFESRAFLSRKPPDGFTYSSYAHEGAAWLTVALGLATLMLSLIFRGITLCDPRLLKLQQLAWIWSILNFALAAAVYNRMLIYIDYNGMTRMRTVALLGITSVVLGFALVLIKIHRKRNFLWLIRRQLWVLGVAVYLYLVAPVDVMIHRYNVTQILAGNPAPVVQITAHEVDDEALPELIPLCDIDDDNIRVGIKAMLSIRHSAVLQDLAASQQLGWTAWQKHRQDSLKSLESNRSRWDTFVSVQDQQAALTLLQEYAYRNWW